MITHDKIFNCVKKFGYLHDPEGMCLGISLMAQQSFFLDDLTSFSSMLRTIAQYDIDDLLLAVEKEESNRLAYIQKLKHNFLNMNFNKNDENDLIEDEKKIFTHAYPSLLQTKLDDYEEQLSEHSRNLLSVRAFLQGIAMYFAPDLYPELFEQNKWFQDISNVFSLLLPSGLMVKEINNEGEKNVEKERPAIEKIESFSGAYTYDELIIYFTSLEEVLKDINEPVSFLLGSCSHSILVGWHPKKKWTFVDAEQLHLVDSNELEKKGVSYLANLVLEAFSESEHAIFNTQVFSRKIIKEEIKNIIHDCQNTISWQKMHQVDLKTQCIDSESSSWLHLAAKHGDTELVKLLISEGMDVNQTDDSGYTPLILATQECFFETAKLLIDNKADVNCVTGENSYAIGLAVDNNDKNMIELLINAGVNIRSSLYYAAQHGQTEILEYLLQNKADPNLSITASIDILRYKAKQNNKEPNLTQLLKHKCITQNELLNFSPLHAAVFFGHTATVEALLNSKYTDINIQTKEGINVFELANIMGHENILYKLREKEIEINQNKNCQSNFVNDFLYCHKKRTVDNVNNNQALNNNENDKNNHNHHEPYKKYKTDNTQTNEIFKKNTLINTQHDIAENDNNEPQRDTPGYQCNHYDNQRVYPQTFINQSENNNENDHSTTDTKKSKLIGSEGLQQNNIFSSNRLLNLAKSFETQKKMDPLSSNNRLLNLAKSFEPQKKMDPLSKKNNN